MKATAHKKTSVRKKLDRAAASVHERGVLPDDVYGYVVVHTKSGIDRLHYLEARLAVYYAPDSDFLERKPVLRTSQI